MTSKTKTRGAVNQSIIWGRRNDRLSSIPVTLVTFLKLAQVDRVHFRGRPMTELAARCMLTEARRNTCARSASSADSVKRADRKWKWRPKGGGRPPKVGDTHVYDLYRVMQAKPGVKGKTVRAEVQS